MTDWTKPTAYGRQRVQGIFPNVALMLTSEQIAAVFSTLHVHNPLDIAAYDNGKSWRDLRIARDWRS